METFVTTAWNRIINFLFGKNTNTDQTLQQRLLIANLWVILVTIFVSAILLFPFGETGVWELVAGFIPYVIANIIAIHLANQGRVVLSLIGYTTATFVMHATVLVIMQRIPPHMVLGMANFIILHGVVLGSRSALIVTALTAFVGTVAPYTGHYFAPWVFEFMQYLDLHPIMGIRAESLSLATTTLSTGFLVITSVEMQSQTRSKLTMTLTQLRRAQTDLELRHARAEGLADLGAKLAVATTPEAAEKAAEITIFAGLSGHRVRWLNTPPTKGLKTMQFGSGPHSRWLEWSDEDPEDSHAFVKTIADLHDGALTRMNSDARLAEAARMEGVGRLAASIAHDFNNLLVPIRAANDFCELEENVSPRMLLGMNASRAATAQAMALISKLLTHSRSREASNVLVNLTRILQEAEPLLRTFVSENVSLEISTPDFPISARMDPVEVEQVVLNLVLNARDAIGKGGVITVLLARDGNDAVLTVSDNGPGIPEELREWVLGAFHTTRAEGTGLGLATVARITRESMGSLCISKSIQGGAAMTVRIPTVPNNEEDQGSSETIEIMKPAQTFRILIVDDDPIVGEIMSELTESLGHEAILVDTASEALAHLGNDATIDLVLTDYQMGELTGEQLLQRVRNLSDMRPVVIITGYGTSLTIEGPHAPEAILAKPIGRIELGRLYNELLS